ncbi:common plant regulatory factor 1-like isoform X1 [Panicum virgatum]|uniref:common plant regulatory factor 1-like isoform X1 n=1 Tax=Panicum virgatum TaxID=38727 RepID=UPI0019D58385|nr:common plant regulatory factor 1-like isoform X1 [Panicum virgatum]
MFEEAISRLHLRPATPPVGSLTPGTPRRYRRCPRFGFVQNVPYTAGEPVAAPEGKSKRKSSGAPSVGNASRSSDGRSEETSDKRYASVEHKDDGELKSERRNQSNRESARRSRLRKQQKCEELDQKVTDLAAINGSLRSELD